MIRITVELVPYGNELQKKIIATGDIINDGSGNMKYGNYIYKLYNHDKLYKEGKVKKFSRLKYNIWKLILKTLRG